LVQAVLSLVKGGGIAHFVDFGCGRGDVIIAVARACPETACVGVDIDEEALTAARLNGQVTDTRNLTFILDDVIACAALAQDVAYLYLGGALNQRLGHLLIDSGRCRRVLAAKYPVIGTVPTSMIETEAGSLFSYETEMLVDCLEWDCAGSEIVLPAGGRYLLTRAVRPIAHGHLTLLNNRFPDTGVRILDWEFGLVPARPGVPTILDLLIEADVGAMGRRVVIPIRAALNGRPLDPSHVIVVEVVTAGSRPPGERLLNAKEASQSLSMIALNL
jgi:SAM-dependent methyltransferase